VLDEEEIYKNPSLTLASWLGFMVGGLYNYGVYITMIDPQQTIQSNILK
jgi:hypothetical protein